ncbi:hypothetical protein ACL02T_23000 [Pseudonocardia sp. RS010]|uniref:hypothetical protein n=1 Tax=Pseudonocardia sp. RS010 TaxID=3385979 RepID=UPI0039A09150
MGTLTLYAAVGYGTVTALRLLRRRWAGQAEPDGDADVPYGPSPTREHRASSIGGRS